MGRHRRRSVTAFPGAVCDAGFCIFDDEDLGLLLLVDRVPGVVGEGEGAIDPGAGFSGSVPGATGASGEPGVGRLLPFGGVAGATGCVGVGTAGGVMVV